MTEYLLRTRHYAECYQLLPVTLCGRYSSHPHFRDEGAKCREARSVPSPTIHGAALVPYCCCGPRIQNSQTCPRGSGPPPGKPPAFPEPSCAALTLYVVSVYHAPVSRVGFASEGPPPSHIQITVGRKVTVGTTLKGTRDDHAISSQQGGPAYL